MTEPTLTWRRVLANPWVMGVTLLLFIAGNAVILPQVGHFEELSGGVAMLEVPTQLGGDPNDAGADAATEDLLKQQLQQAGGLIE